MTRTALDLNRISAKALKIQKIGRNYLVNGNLEQWNPADDEAQNAMCLDWLIANVQSVQFDRHEMTVAIKGAPFKYYPCRTPAERRLAVLQAVADVEEAGNAE